MQTKHNWHPFKSRYNVLFKVIVVSGISLLGWKCMDSSRKTKLAKSTKLSLCDKIDSVVHQQKRKFRDIKEEAYYMRPDTEVYYNATINMSAVPSAIIYNYQTKNLFFRGYFDESSDSNHSVQLFDSLKHVIKSCLPDWETRNLVDVDRVFPFTRFFKDDIQIELYYLKNSRYDSIYTVGMVVEAFK